MENYKQLYSEKLVSAEKLAERLESGWVIGMDNAASQTPAIMEAFTEKVKNSDLKGIKVHTMLDVYPYEFYASNALDGKINGVSWFSSAGSRKAVNGGYADFIPNYYRDTPKLIRENYDYDAFCVAVSPMDSHGYFSLATTASYSEAMIDKARRIFVEVNENQPRCLCGLQLHVFFFPLYSRTNTSASPIEPGRLSLLVLISAFTENEPSFSLKSSSLSLSP